MDKNKKYRFDTVIRVSANQVHFHPRFQGMFLYNKENEENIKKNMQVNGFDKGKPVYCLQMKNKLYVYDGEHRTRAAQSLDIPVYIIIKDITIDQACQDSREKQALSRSINPAEIYQNISKTLDSQKDVTYYDKRNCKRSSPIGEDRETLKKKLLEAFKISSRTIDRYYFIYDHGKEKHKQLLLGNCKSVSAIEKMIRNESGNQKTRKKPAKNKEEIQGLSEQEKTEMIIKQQFIIKKLERKLNRLTKGGKND